MFYIALILNDKTKSLMNNYTEKCIDTLLR